MKPKVSIILPTYNRADYLRRSISSVLNQTYADFELIIVDDASTDKSKEIIDSIKDQRIIYLRHEKNQGGSAARNTGIKAARADMVAFQDSDDEWLPDKLEKQLKMMADAPPSVGVVYTGFWRMQEGAKEYIPGPQVQIKEGDIHRELLNGNFITTQAVLVKKECLQKAGGFDETLPRFQDWELFLRIAKHFEFRYIAEPLVNSFFTDGSISSKPQAMISALEIILAKHIDEYKDEKNIYSAMLHNMANLYRLDDNIKKSRKYLIEAIKVKHNPLLLVLMMTSFAGSKLYNNSWNTALKIKDFMTRI